MIYIKYDLNLIYYNLKCIISYIVDMWLGQLSYLMNSHISYTHKFINNIHVNNNN